jgi:hypothetical protein
VGIKTPEDLLTSGSTENCISKYYFPSWSRGQHGADIYAQLANHSFSYFHDNSLSEFPNGPVFYSCNISASSLVSCGPYPRSVLLFLIWSFLHFSIPFAFGNSGVQRPLSYTSFPTFTWDAVYAVPGLVHFIFMLFHNVVCNLEAKCILNFSQFYKYHLILLRCMVIPQHLLWFHDCLSSVSVCSWGLGAWPLGGIHFLLMWPFEFPAILLNCLSLYILFLHFSLGVMSMPCLILKEWMAF